MLILLAIVLLLVLPSPWNVVGFLAVLPVWVLELVAWSHTVRHRRRVVGAETLVGLEGSVITACRPLGQVRLDGEIWQARCDEGAVIGEQVRVVGLDRLTLVVHRVGGNTG